MPINYRYDPFGNVSTAVNITNEAHTVPSSSPFDIKLNEVPKHDAPSTLVVKVKDALAAAITTSGATTITVTRGTWFAIGNTITIDSEQMYVSGIASNVLTVTRGYNSTTATTHSLGTAVYIESSMSEVEASPAAGQFWADYSTGADGQSDWNTGTLRFNEADADKTLVISYVGTGTLVDTRLTHGMAVFTESGPWTCPDGITEAYITECGAGAGGGGASGTTSYRGAGGGGGGGQAYLKHAVTVVPGQTYNIVIGAGGTGGSVSPGAGGDGGDTSFGSLLTAAGGKGGGKATSSGSDKGVGGAAGGAGGNAGGTGGVANGDTYFSGSGGGCLLGSGACGNGATMTGNSCSCYGGGGSGAMSGLSMSGTAGGGGGNGICIVEW